MHLLGDLPCDSEECSLSGPGKAMLKIVQFLTWSSLFGLCLLFLCTYFSQCECFFQISVAVISSKWMSLLPLWTS